MNSYNNLNGEVAVYTKLCYNKLFFKDLIIILQHGAADNVLSVDCH